MTGLETRRFDAKLDSFLRRRLAQEDFERVCTSEPCVVVSPEDKRVHRHVVLCHRCLYLTEVPPKNLKTALHVRDISSIRMLNDLPDFLSGSEQENTVHVQIHYRRQCKEKKLLKSLGEKSPSFLKRLAKSSEEQNHTQNPFGSSSSISDSLHHLALSHSPTSERAATSSRQGSTLSLPSTSPDCAGASQGRSHSSLGTYCSPRVGKRSPQLLVPDPDPPERSRSLSPLATEDLYSYRRSPLLTHRTPPLTCGSTSLADQSRSTTGCIQHYQKALTNGHLSSYLGTTFPQTNQHRKTVNRRAAEIASKDSLQSGHRGSLKNLSRSSHLAGSSSKLSLSPSSSPELPDGHDVRVSEQLSTRMHKSSLSKHHYSSFPNFFSTSNEDLAVGVMSTSASLMKLNDRQDSTLSLLSTVSTSTTQPGGGDGECGKLETAVMDLYILKQSSDFYHHLCVAWTNFKINEVYSQEEGESPTPSKPQRQPHDHFSQKFCTLKQELLTSSAGRLDTSARLAQELCTASEKYFIIKKMFWEDSELYEFCLAQLRHNLLTDAKRVSSSTNRGDQLEYSLILLDLFYQMLKETQLFNKKLVMLTRNGGQLLLDLAKAVVHCVPAPMTGDSEFADLDSELTEKSCAVLYELIQVTQQARWPLARKTTVSLSWLVEALVADSAIKTFCSRMVSYASHIIGRGTMASTSITVAIGSAAGMELDTQAQVTLFHLTTVMNTLVQNSTDVVKLLRTNFAEEFRYFIRVSKAQQKLPESLSLTGDTLHLLKAIKSKVLT